jgi:tetratricopeptide (TPR) repeat protein
MTLGRLVVMCALLFPSSSAGFAAPRVPAADPPADPRMARLEFWLNAVLQHQPGSADADVFTVGSWGNADLRTLLIDASSLVQLIHDPAEAGQGARVLFSFKPQGATGWQPVRYTTDQVVRLKQLACAVGGIGDEPPCEWARAATARDPALSRLSALAGGAERGGDRNSILRRGALLHADIVMLGVAVPAEPMESASPGSQSIRVIIADGQQTALTQSGLHWEIGRRLLDQVSPAGFIKPAPERDAMVRLWYVATASWMQREGHHENTHLDRARALFPNDADLLFLTGAQHETYAGPPIQTAVRSAVMPTGVQIAVGSERAELRDAERYLRRALDVNPEFVEARLRLGHVLALTDRDAEAARELERALASSDEPVLAYFGALFLGAVEETRGHVEAAKALNERAAALYPRAQSPRLALSELARRAGSRDEALGEIAHVFALGRDAGNESDPWWTYDTAPGRHADALLERLRAPFRLVTEP